MHVMRKCNKRIAGCTKLQLKAMQANAETARSLAELLLNYSRNEKHLVSQLRILLLDANATHQKSVQKPRVITTTRREERL